MRSDRDSVIENDDVRLFKCRECGDKHPTEFCSTEDSSICRWCSGEEEETFMITPYGYVSQIIGEDDARIVMEQIFDYMKSISCNAIVFEDWSGSFEKVSREWDKEKN